MCQYFFWVGRNTATALETWLTSRAGGGYFVCWCGPAPLLAVWPAEEVSGDRGAVPPRSLPTSSEYQYKGLNCKPSPRPTSVHSQHRKCGTRKRWPAPPRPAQPSPASLAALLSILVWTGAGVPAPDTSQLRHSHNKEASPWPRSTLRSPPPPGGNLYNWVWGGGGGGGRKLRLLREARLLMIISDNFGLGRAPPPPRPGSWAVLADYRQDEQWMVQCGPATPPRHRWPLAACSHKSISCQSNINLGAALQLCSHHSTSPNLQLQPSQLTAANMETWKLKLHTTQQQAAEERVAQHEGGNSKKLFSPEINVSSNVLIWWTIREQCGERIRNQLI